MMVFRKHIVGAFYASLLTLTLVVNSSNVFADEYAVHAIVMGDEFTGLYNNPSALFYDEEKSRLYVADSGNGRLISYDPDLEYLSEWSHDDLISPVSLVKNSNGKFYALDSGDHKIKYVDPGAAEIRVLELKDVPKSVSILIPGNIAIGGNDHLYIIDKMNSRIVELDSEEKYVKSYSTVAKDFYGFNDLYVDTEGTVFAVDTIGRKIYIFKKDGKLLKSFGGPAYKKGGGSLLFPISISLDTLGNIHVLDSHRGKILVYDRLGILKYDIGERGFGMGSFHDPSCFILDKQRRIYTLESGRVQVLKRINE